MRVSCRDALLSLGGVAPAKKDKPGPNWMPADEAKWKLIDAGYSGITELEAEDWDWVGEDLKEGLKMDFHVIPRTGAITDKQPDED